MSICVLHILLEINLNLSIDHEYSKITTKYYYLYYFTKKCIEVDNQTIYTLETNNPLYYVKIS